MTRARSPEEVYQRRWLTLGVLCLSLMVISVDNTILNVALPSIVRELNAQGSQLQWIIDAYTIVFAGLLLTAGSLGDRFGRKGALTLGLVLFGGVLGGGIAVASSADGCSSSSAASWASAARSSSRPPCRS